MCMNKTADRHDQDPMVQLTVLIPSDDIKGIKEICKKEDRTKGYVVREAISRYLAQKGRRTA